MLGVEPDPKPKDPEYPAKCYDDHGKEKPCEKEPEKPDKSTTLSADTPMRNM